MEHTEYMLEALTEADRCGDDVPVGAVVVRDGRIIARAHNQREGFGPDAVLDHGPPRPWARSGWMAAPFMSLWSPAPCAPAP